jgi:hypothetical protein
MTVHPIVFVVPVYALLIALELWQGRRPNRDVYDIPELMANVGAGLGQLLVRALAATGRPLDGARWARRDELVRVVAVLAFSFWSWHSARLG